MTYDVTRTGPKGFLVTATRHLGTAPQSVGDFASLVEAEAIADMMRQLRSVSRRGGKGFALMPSLQAASMPAAGRCQLGILAFLPQSLLRGLVALLTTPFLLLTVLVIGCWLKASGKLLAHRRMLLDSVVSNIVHVAPADGSPHMKNRPSGPGRPLLSMIARPGAPVV